MHRILRLLCLLTAVIVLVVSAQITRRLAETGVKEIQPIDESVPELTMAIVVPIAEGRIPIVTIAAALACLAALVGLFAIFSTRLSREAAGTTLLLVCTIALVLAAAAIAVTAIAISIGRAPAL